MQRAQSHCLVVGEAERLHAGVYRRGERYYVLNSAVAKESDGVCRQTRGMKIVRKDAAIYSSFASFPVCPEHNTDLSLVVCDQCVPPCDAHPGQKTGSCLLCFEERINAKFDALLHAIQELVDIRHSSSSSAGP